jgi:hypothetical protein
MLEKSLPFRWRSLFSPMTAAYYEMQLAAAVASCCAQAHLGENNCFRQTGKEDA